MLGVLKLQWLAFFLVLIGLLTACASTSSHNRLNRDLQNGIKYYRVQSGDTLYSIGNRAGYDYHQLAKWNQIKPPYKIQVGQTLKLFGPAQKPWINQKKRTASQKKLIISNSNRMMLRLGWQWPVKGKILRSFFKTGKKGIDILGKYGQSVRSTAAGKVVYSGDGLIGYGNLIIIKHNQTYLSAYANNSRLLAKQGQQVKKGQIIAEIGRAKDQLSTLHFEIRKHGKPVNPIEYLPAQ